MNNPATAVKSFFTGSSTKKPPHLDFIVSYWRAHQPLKLHKPRVFPDTVLTNIAQGLGDTLMLTDLPRAAFKQERVWTSFSNSQHFRPLISYNPEWKEPALTDHVNLINAPCLIRYRDCGNGHYLQRIRRAFGLEVESVPKPYIGWTGLRKQNRVILHFDPGGHVQWQRQHVHPRARSLYAETKTELEKFISVNKHLEFIIVGSTAASFAIRGARFAMTSSIQELVNTIGSGGWFIGIMSGPLHLAVALGLRCISIVNFPEPQKILLPTLRQSDQIESEWFYPQNVHLHQEGSTDLVPKASLSSFQRAFNGEVFPYWKTDHCDLIHEKL